MKSNLNNKVNLIGHTGSTVELINFESGSKKASVSLATSDSYKNSKGEYVKQTQWHNIIAWGRNAELFAKAISKGDQVIIDGTLQYRSYTDKSGLERFVTEVVLIDFMKAGKSDKSKATEPVESEAVEPTPF